MAVGFEVWSDRHQRTLGRDRSLGHPVLSRQERLDRIHRIRRRSQAQAALEGVVWLAGSAAVVALLMAGMVGLR